MGVKLRACLRIRPSTRTRFLGREKETRERKTAKGRLPFRDSLAHESKSTPTWRGSFREAVFGFRARATRPTFFFFNPDGSFLRERRSAETARYKRGARNKLITSFCQEWFYDRVRSRTACVSRVVLFLLSHRRVPVLPAANGGWTRRLTARAAPSPSPRFAARRRAARAGPPPPGWGAS